MTDKRILLIYRQTCRAAGRIVDPTVGEKWAAALGRFKKEEVLGAIEAWRRATEPAQGSLLGKPKGGPLPEPADLRRRILEAREAAWNASDQAERQRQDLEHFWRVVDERGISDAEIAERWPSYVGTRPAKREDAA